MEDVSLTEEQKCILKCVTKQEFWGVIKLVNPIISQANLKKLLDRWQEHHDNGRMVYTPEEKSRKGTVFEWKKPEGLLFDAETMRLKAAVECPRAQKKVGGRQLKDIKDLSLVQLDYSNGWAVDHYLSYCRKVAEYMLQQKGNDRSSAIALSDSDDDEECMGSEYEAVPPVARHRLLASAMKQAADTEEEDEDEDEEEDEAVSNRLPDSPPASAVAPEVQAAPEEEAEVVAPPVGNKRTEEHADAEDMIRRLKRAKTIPDEKRKELEDKVRDARAKKQTNIEEQQRIFETLQNLDYEIDGEIQQTSKRAIIKFRDGGGDGATATSGKLKDVYHDRKSAIVRRMETKISYDFIRASPLYKDREVRFEAFEIALMNAGVEQRVRVTDMLVKATDTLPPELNEVKIDVSAAALYAGTAQVRLAKLLTSDKHSSGFEHYVHNLLVPEPPPWWHVDANPDVKIVVIDGLKKHLIEKAEEIKAMVEEDKQKKKRSSKAAESAAKAADKAAKQAVTAANAAAKRDEVASKKLALAEKALEEAVERKKKITTAGNGTAV